MWTALGTLTVLAATAVVIGVVPALAPAMLVGGAPQLERIVLPPGFRIEVYAEGVDGARSLARGPDGTVFAGSRGAGRVYALLDRDDGQRRRASVKVVARGLNSPNGVAWRDGALYVAEISRVLRFEGLAGRLDDPPAPAVVNDSFPTETHHGWKFIRWGPDGMLYVPVGAPCNLCDPEDPRFASIMRMHADGTGLEIFAHGVRNTVGFDWHPRTGVLWFTDNGRDWMGENRPPDELNRAPHAGMHFGFPYCHGRDVAEPEFQRLTCDETTPPVVELAPHAAALGMRFYSAGQFPERYRGGIFIAEHGSWNRTVPIGYRIVFVPVDGGGHAAAPEVFASGWLRDGVAWGRPVDVEILADGSMLVSDDKAGVVYRISYGGGRPQR